MSCSDSSIEGKTSGKGAHVWLASDGDLVLTGERSDKLYDCHSKMVHDSDDRWQACFGD